MALKSFDRKFGRDLMSLAPPSPGVYRVYDSDDRVIYVGKAKNLRRRLSQYRNAKRRKKHLKMRRIVSEGVRLDFLPLASDEAAQIEELRLIQALRPKWNVAGVFSFLYPLVGVRSQGARAEFLLTWEPDRWRGEFELHGAYRSRWITGDAFFAWMRLLRYLGHRIFERKPTRTPGRAGAKTGRTYRFCFRQLPLGFTDGWSLFLKGESAVALQELSVQLLENAGARRDSEQVEEDLKSLRRFWLHEAVPLRRALAFAGESQDYPVPQSQRDFLFIKFRSARVSRTGRA